MLGECVRARACVCLCVCECGYARVFMHARMSVCVCGWKEKNSGG